MLDHNYLRIQSDCSDAFCVLDVSVLRENGREVEIPPPGWQDPYVTDQEECDSGNKDVEVVFA